MTVIDRIQAYLRQSARQQYTAISTPPFTVFLHPTSDFLYFNYAIPDTPAAGDLRAPLARLRAAFREHGRRPRFEFIEEFAPALGPILRDSGFIENQRLQLMVCTPASYRAAPAVPGLRIAPLTSASTPTDVRDFINTQRQSFDPDGAPLATDTDVAEFALGGGNIVNYLARLDGRAVAVGSYMTPFNGMTEVAGIGTLSAFRRRGIAAAVTAQATRDAFARGVEIACLSAADERAGRVYERVGFAPVATMLAFSDPE